MRRPRFLALLAPVGLFALALAATDGETGEITGHVTLVGAGRAAAAPGTAIWLPGVREANPFYTAQPTIVQKDKRFEPHVLAVRRGATVSFPNLDRIFHNVFSLTPGSPFDLGLYRGGASRQVKLDVAGLVRIYCNIHPQMAAYVLVAEGGSFAVTDADGHYRIGALKPGTLVTRFWHEKGGAKEETVEVRAGTATTLDIRLDASRWVDRPHKNKDGRDYPPVGLDADRY